MFDGAEFPKSLDEELFDLWLEKGRQSKLSYNFLLIIWDEFDSEYQPVYVENREELYGYANHKISTGRERFVAAYDLYSKSKIM